MADEDYSEWSACEFNGHNYVEDEDQPGHHYCLDCGDSYDDDGQE